MLRSISKKKNYRVYLSLFFLISFIVVSISFAENKTNSANKKKANKRICITFDELPIAQYFGEPAKDTLTEMILKALKKHNVKAAGFVVGSRIENNFDLLGQWLNQGHRLGNLTYSHHDFNELETENFISDAVNGSESLEAMLSGFGQKPRFFRFPFLHYGNTAMKKMEIKEFLNGYNIKVAHVTVVVEDYIYNLTVEKKNGVLDSAEYDGLLNEYINHVLDEIERSQRLSKEILGRDCRQILQLRANHLNAIFLDPMLTEIENMGYRFITLDEALKDKLYKMPEAYLGNRGVGYLDMIKMSNPDLLPAE